MAQSYIFGGNTGMSYDQIQKQRDIANELLRANMSTPQNVGEGLSAIGRALAAKAIDKRASRADETNRKAYEAERDRAFQALGGFGGTGGGSAGYSPSGTWTPAPPPPKPTDSFMGNPDTVFSGGNSFNMPAPADATKPSAPLSFGSAVMTPQEMLIAGAEARGLNPIDVATAISYETGGKFDPLIKGPTTQWGQHEGLIQFGDPQGQEHGAVFDQGADAAWRSQLNPNTGAVWSYLDSTGVQPGMGLDQIYSAINAGGVNRFGASDANNGGAPGTVADKVAGMGPHRENAAKFLGGTWTPTEGQAGAAPQPAVGAPAGGMGSPAIIMALAGIQGNPYASDSDKAIANILIEQTVQAMDPMRQMEMERAQLELQQMRQPAQPQTPAELAERQALAAAGGLQPGTPEYQSYMLTGEMPQAAARPLSPDERQFWGIPANDTRPYVMGDQGVPEPIGGGGVTVNNQITNGAEPLGTEGQVLVPDSTDPSGFRVEVAPGSKLAQEREKAESSAEVKEGNAAIASDSVTTAATRALEAANNRLLGGFGQGVVGGLVPQSNAAEVQRQVNVLKSQAIVSNLQAMRDASPTGGALGAVTAPELELLANQAGALDPSSPTFARDLEDYTKTLLRTIHGAEKGTEVFEQWKSGGGETAAEPKPKPKWRIVE
jgi:hypothetical protein